METTLIVSSILLWLTVLFNLFLTFALIRRSNAQAKPLPPGGLDAGTQAPNFTAQTLDGKTITLADYQGRKLALIFFSVACQACRDLLSQFKRMEAEAQQIGVNLLLVSRDEREATEALMAEIDMHLPVLIAPRPGHPFFDEYKVVHTPFYCFINPQGQVQASGLPVVQAGEWKALTTAWDTEKADVLGERR